MLQKLNPGPDSQEHECYPHIYVCVRIMFHLLFSHANPGAFWTACVLGSRFRIPSEVRYACLHVGSPLTADA